MISSEAVAKMKVLVTIFAVAAIVSANELEKKFIESLAECAKEHSVDQEVFDNWGKKELPVEENVKCTLKCTLDKTNLVNADKKLEIPEEAKALFPKESPLWPAIEKCNDVVLDSCDSAFKFSQCVEKHIKELMS